MTSGSWKKQATRWPSPTWRSSGIRTSHSPGIAKAQREWTEQPSGMSRGLGTVPSIGTSFSMAPLVRGTYRMRAWVYGCLGA